MKHLNCVKVNSSFLASTKEHPKVSSPAKTLNKAIHAAMHDVRSPLTTIKPYLDFLKKIDDQTKRDEILDRMKEGIIKMELLMNGLVKYADLICEDSMQIEEINSANFQKIVERQAVFFQSFHACQFQFENTLPFSYHYPKGYLEEVIIILLDNAFKYQSSERNLKLCFSLEQKDGNVLLQIKDNGQGMPESFSPEIAGKAFSKNTNPQRGIGLGFSYIQSMVEKNGGSFDFISSKEGTMVMVKMKTYDKLESRVLHVKNLKVGEKIV